VDFSFEIFLLKFIHCFLQVWNTVSVCKYVTVGMLATSLKYIYVESVILDDELNYLLKYKTMRCYTVICFDLCGRCQIKYAIIVL
jgi:hypothetical protein